MSFSFTLKRFLIIFLPGTLLLSGVFGIFYLSYERLEKKILERQEAYTVESQVKAMAATFQAIESDLLFLAEQRALARFTESKAETDRQQVIAEYLSFCRQKGFYDQIRFLDMEGMEIIRVNARGEEVWSVPGEDLQPKKGRYYFADILERSKGEIQISPLDLNMERGQVERPFKPVIRFGTPVFDKTGEKCGIVVLNYIGRQMLDRLQTLSRGTQGQLLLADSAGHWLVGPTENDHWSMISEDAERTSLSRSFPVISKKIWGAASGQILSRQGLFTFRHFPAEGSGGMGEPPLVTTVGWVVISHVSRESLEAKYRPLIKKLALFFALMVAIQAGICFFLARAQVHRRKEEVIRRRAETDLKASLKEKGVLLQEIHHRVKNNLQLISSMFRLQARFIDHPDTRLIFRESENRIQAIASIHELLYKSEDMSNLRIQDYLHGLGDYLAASYGRDGIEMAVEVGNISLPMDVGISCGLIVNELVSNAMKHAFPADGKGIVKVRISSSAQSEIQLIVEDNGRGLPEGFNPLQSNTMGLRLVRLMVEELGGILAWNSHEGTHFQITFNKGMS